MAGVFPNHVVLSAILVDVGSKLVTKLMARDIQAIHHYISFLMSGRHSTLWLYGRLYMAVWSQRNLKMTKIGN